MGYTHYWTQKRDFSQEEWTDVCADIAAILAFVEHGADSPLANGAGDPGTHPLISNKIIQLNGVGENAHETFTISRLRTKERDYGSSGEGSTKTARKPYDLAVTACLCYFSSVTETHSVTSDGSGPNFTAGLMAAREALPQKANLLDYPIAVLEADRWTGPWVKNQEGSGYQVEFCVDGYGYVWQKKSKSWYRFDSHEAIARFLREHRQASFRSTGRTSFGDYGRDEPDIWDATGSFDQKRHLRLARAQAKVLQTLFPADQQHALAPPAYIRPDDLVRYRETSTFSYSLTDLLARLPNKAA